MTTIGTLMKNTFILFSLIAAVASTAWAADDSIIYLCEGENATEEHDEIERKTRAVFSSDFTIVDVANDTNYVDPELIAGGLPKTALSDSGQQLEGSVWVAYVVTTDGRAVEPRVLETTDQRLNTTAFNALNKWRFAPAKFNGVAVQTAAATPFSFKIEDAPTEFVMQILEPTGGKILRPKEWFYSEGHRERAYMWTISRENTAGNKRYRTGVRIQAFTGLKAATGKTAKQFILDFAVSRKEKATRVYKECEEKDLGFVTRICIETQERGNHILYSLFWGSREMDVAVISIAGTTEELWETYSSTFNKMGEFELIDMERFEK
ncbi:MAG: hypothetical protein HKN47_04385 [Pirellulaceae bacterium]|nr:hypothetical protein [Pirellulaceae bacterium]